MGGSINFGDNLHAVAGRHFLKVDELLLGVVAVAGREARVGLALQAEGGVGLVPGVVEAAEANVVEMDLQGVHLVVTHHAHQLAEVVHGDVFAAAVEHEAAHLKVGAVVDGALRQVGRLVEQLQQGACGPEGAGGRGGGDGHVAADGHTVALGLFAVAAGAQHNVAVAPLAVGHHAEAGAADKGIVVGQLAGHLLVGCIAGGADDA